MVQFDKTEEMATLRPVLIGNLVGDVIGFLVALIGTFGGVMNSLS